MSIRIGLLGFGEVGRALADDVAARGTALAAWDLLFADPASAPSDAARIRGVRIGADAPDAVRDADLVISAVTAAQTVAAAEAAAPGLQREAMYLDLNSASPDAKIEAARKIQAVGGLYIEAAVMSPILPLRAGVPILLGGAHAAGAAPLLRGLGFTGASVFSAELGKASAAKLCRSVIVKGVEALLCESLFAARRYGVEDAVIDSLGDLFPGCDWPTLSRYMIARAILHGTRRAEEMREAARTVEAAGLAPLAALATAQRQEWAAAFKPALAHDALPALLDAIHDLQKAGRA